MGVQSTTETGTGGERLANNSAAADQSRTTDDLYFIKAGDFVKIGRTRNLSARLVSVQTGCPYPIDQAFSFPGWGKMERELHGRLHNARAHGEWFRWGSETEAQLNWLRRQAFPTSAGATAFARLPRTEGTSMTTQGFPQLDTPSDRAHAIRTLHAAADILDDGFHERIVDDLRTIAGDLESLDQGERALDLGHSIKVR